MSIISHTTYRSEGMLQWYYYCNIFSLLLGNSSLPRCFDVFKDPDPFFTQPAQQFPGNMALPCSTFPMQSSVIYSPPSSCTPSESSAPSPMSSTDGWIINDDWNTLMIYLSDKNVLYFFRTALIWTFKMSIKNNLVLYPETFNPKQ